MLAFSHKVLTNSWNYIAFSTCYSAFLITFIASMEKSFIFFFKHHLKIKFKFYCQMELKLLRIFIFYTIAFLCLALNSIKSFNSSVLSLIDCFRCDELLAQSARKLHETEDQINFAA